jgi:hypothetical protein
MDCPNLRLWRWMNNNDLIVETGSPLQKLGVVHLFYLIKVKACSISITISLNFIRPILRQIKNDYTESVKELFSVKSEQKIIYSFMREALTHAFQFSSQCVRINILLAPPSAPITQPAFQTVLRRNPSRKPHTASFQLQHN